MTELKSKPSYDESIKQSWERCEVEHGLVRSTAKPVLRLQSTEIAPRLEEVVERTGGRLGVFSELSKLSTDAGHSLVVADADGVVVRFESQAFGRDAFENNGIALGSCWDERIAGTNGVSMAMALDDAITVRGRQHFHASLAPFACTAAPIVDADNVGIGYVSLSAFDRGVPSDHLIAKKLLLAAVGRVQSKLFEAKFQDKFIVSVSPIDYSDLFRRHGLVALDEKGHILGATARAYELAGTAVDGDLAGQNFETVFGADARDLHSVPDRVLSVKAESGTALNVSFHNRERHERLFPGWRPPTLAPVRGKARKRIVPQIRDLICGSQRMAKCCARVEAHISRSYPVVIEGESGTGKSALVAALRHNFGPLPAQIMTVDCAELSGAPENLDYLENVFAQARVVQALDRDNREMSMLVFDNADEMPEFAQASLRGLLDDVERDVLAFDEDRFGSGLRIIALSRNRLAEAVEAGRFREDLYYMLAGAIVTLPPLRQRENLLEIASLVGSKIAGTDIEITKEAAAILAAHNWPGNVRELRNVLQQALLEGDGRRISLLDLQFLNNHRDQRPPVAKDPGPRSVLAGHMYDEKTMLVDALNATHWNVSQAARLLGIGRATINRKIKVHGLSRPN